MPLHTVTLDLPADLEEDQVGRFSETLDDIALSTSILRLRHAAPVRWQVQWVLEECPDQADLIARLSLARAAFGAALDAIPVGVPVIAAVPDTNWLEQSYRGLSPFTVGPFYIHGSHAAEPAPPGLIALQIDAATAFGSGEHGTTSACLLLLAQLKQNGFSPCSILDMGCGSGILAIAAKKLWDNPDRDIPVLAADIDPEAVRITQLHAAANNVEIGTIAGDGFAVIENNYDLIIANILPGPLKAMAADMTSRTRPGGFLILSGLLTDQATAIADIYAQAGAPLQTRLDRGEWAALLLQKSNS